MRERRGCNRNWRRDKGHCCSNLLNDAGISTTVLESSDVVGGRIGVVPFGSEAVELGGRNIQSHQSIFDLFGHYGIHELDNYPIDSVNVGSKYSLDFRQTGGRAAKYSRAPSRIFSEWVPAALLQVRAVAKKARSNKDGWQIGSSVWSDLAERTSDATVLQYFGPKVAEGVFRAWTVRTMGAEPEEVYIGNLAPMLGKREISIKRMTRGMTGFLQAAAGALNIQCGHVVQRLLLNRGRVVGVAGQTPDGASFLKKRIWSYAPSGGYRRRYSQQGFIRTFPGPSTDHLPTCRDCCRGICLSDFSRIRSVVYFCLEDPQFPIFPSNFITMEKFYDTLSVASPLVRYLIPRPPWRSSWPWVKRLFESKVEL